MDALTNFDVRQCHKWAQLLLTRHQKLKQAQDAVETHDFDLAKRLFNQIFTGVPSGKQADPGMAGSLLYHMAMVTKMESETQVLLDALNVELPEVSAQLSKIYGDFESDAKELTQEVAPLHLGLQEITTSTRLGTKEKIILFNKLKQENKKVESTAKQQRPQSMRRIKEPV